MIMPGIGWLSTPSSSRTYVPKKGNGGREKAGAGLGAGKKSASQSDSHNVTLAVVGRILEDGLATAFAEGLLELIKQMNQRMWNAAAELKLELAVSLSDEVAI